MNRCHFIGRMVNDPFLESISDAEVNTKVVRFKLSICRRFKKKNTGEIGKHIDYLDFEAWDSGAEAIANNFKRGDTIIIHASARSYLIDDVDGDKTSKTVFRVEEFEFPSEQGLVSKRYNYDEKTT